MAYSSDSTATALLEALYTHMIALNGNFYHSDYCDMESLSVLQIEVNTCNTSISASVFVVQCI